MRGEAKFRFGAGRLSAPAVGSIVPALANYARTGHPQRWWLGETKGRTTSQSQQPEC